MTVRGTRNLLGEEANKLFNLQTSLEGIIKGFNFQRFIPSSLAYLETFRGKIGNNRMYEFKDRSERDLVLIPEVTGIVREEYISSWCKGLPKPIKLFYSTRVYRYDKPQFGRYREFTQFGVEVLGGKFDSKSLLVSVLGDVADITKYEVRDVENRGQDYYTGPGFEVWKDGLQVAGGGPYPEGEGWAIGVERLLLTMED